VGQPKPLRPDVNVTARCGKSAVAERILDTGHKIYFDNTYRLIKVSNYMDLVAMSVAMLRTSTGWRSLYYIEQGNP
jgi:hypothetical protein